MVLARTKEAAAALSAQAAGTDMQKNLRGCHPGRVAKSGRAADRLPAAGWQDQHLPGGGQKDAGSEESFAGLQDTVGTDNGSETVFGGNPSAYRPPPSDPVQFAHAGTSLVGDNKYGSMSNAVQEAGNGSVCIISSCRECDRKSDDCSRTAARCFEKTHLPSAPVP